MANMKKTTDVNSSEININALIKEAVEKAINETSKQYQNKIDKLQEQLKSQDEQEESSPSIKPEKMIKIMSMSPGNASFNRGRVNVKFNKLFDERRIKFEILDEMYYAFKQWFDDFEIVILDKEVRQYLGIEYSFKEHGADKVRFHEILKMSNLEMLQNIGEFSLVVAWAFLTFFVEEYIKSNPDCIKDNKFNEIQNHYASKYSIHNIQEAIGEMMSK